MPKGDTGRRIRLYSPYSYELLAERRQILARDRLVDVDVHAAQFRLLDVDDAPEPPERRLLRADDGETGAGAVCGADQPTARPAVAETCIACTSRSAEPAPWSCARGS